MSISFWTLRYYMICIGWKNNLLRYDMIFSDGRIIFGLTNAGWYLASVANWTFHHDNRQWEVINTWNISWYFNCKSCICRSYMFCLCFILILHRNHDCLNWWWYSEPKARSYVFALGLGMTIRKGLLRGNQENCWNSFNAWKTNLICAHVKWTSYNQTALSKHWNGTGI